MLKRNLNLGNRIGALFSNLRIAFKILIAPFFTAIMMISLWTIATIGLRDQVSLVDSIVKNSVESVIAANSVYEKSTAIQSDVFRLLVWHSARLDDERIQSVYTRNDERLAGFMDDVSRLRSAVSADRVARVDEIANLAEQFHQTARAANEVAFQSPSQGSGMAVTSADVYDRFRERLRAFQRNAEERADRDAIAARSSAERLVRLLGVVVIVDITLAVSITLFVSRHISAGFRRITATTTELAKGNLETPIEGQARRDEIGAMARALGVLKDSERERRRLEEERVQAEKMASLGGMVAGVAHEINTPIGVCITAVTDLDDKTQRIESKVNEGTLKKSDLTNFLHYTRENVNLIKNNADRAGKQIKSFKNVAVDQTSETKRTFELRAYCDEVIDSLYPQLKQSQVQVKNKIASDLDMVSYPGPLGQVITNLILNAVFHAFDEGESGSVVIEAVPSADDSAVVLSVADDGRGMAEETRRNIFEPFYTTARNAGGSGLGLHIVYNIVTNTLAGKIECRSSEGAGTTFVVTMPKDPEPGTDAVSA